MKTEAEIRERIKELRQEKRFALECFAPDHIINEIDAELLALRWVLGE